METSSANYRYTFIELLAYWEGRINTRDLERQFGLSRQQSSTDINRYKAFAPHNLVYDASRKYHCPAPEFQCLYIPSSVDMYLQWLETGQLPTHSHSTLTANLQLPARKIAPLVMRGLVAAIRQSQRLEVDYVSLNNPNHQGRIISPHSFVRTGLRWHLRAWCEKSRGYRDFVLSRFRGEPELLDAATFKAEGDVAWNTQVTVLLQPDPRLSPAKRAVLENDYQMQDGQLAITTRGCLVQYLLRELQVSTKVLDGTPEAQQLVCVNLLDIKQWLFEG